MAAGNEKPEAEGVCLIVGTGQGLGRSLAHAFAQEGLIACVTRRERNLNQAEALVAEIRTSGGQAHAYGVDARDENSMVRLFDEIEANVGALEVVVFNIGANVRFPIRDTTSRVYRKVWEMSSYAGFLTGREAARVMAPRGHGTIIFTGASASVRGLAGFAAFAGAKHALRALSQSMARELNPLGIHVAHALIDGLMDGTFARRIDPDVEAHVAEGRILDPDAVAASYVHLWQQSRSAWTQEIDLRPWTETF